MRFACSKLSWNDARASSYLPSIYVARATGYGDITVSRCDITEYAEREEETYLEQHPEVEQRRS